jgi:monoamine oxidase
MVTKGGRRDMTNDYDVIVVGAGFAGAAAARECATRGYRTLVLEGRDRIGGRTWTTALADGEVVELGGTWFHPWQAHVWTEISRYGLEHDVVDGFEKVEWSVALRDGEYVWTPVDGSAEVEDNLTEHFFAHSREVFPRPWDPLFARDEVEKVDWMSVRDRIDEMGVTAEEAARLEVGFIAQAGDVATGASYVNMLRWWARGGHTAAGVGATSSAYKFKHGTAGLLRVMLADGGAELRLGSAVTRVAASSEGAEVTCRDGAVYRAGAVIVATPSGVWPRIEFAPPLPDAQAEAAREGMQSRYAAKAIVALKGESRHFHVQVRDEHPLMTLRARSADEQIAVLFPGASMIDPGSPDEIRELIREALPHVEVTEIVNAFYGDDEFSLGGWPALKPGQLTRFAPHETFTSHGDRVFFATSDIARLWTGFIDGAIESGIRAGREARQILGRRSG